MKKTLAVLMAALLACACFATIGSAAEIKAITQNTEDYPRVTLDSRGKALTALFDGNKTATTFTDSVFFKNEDATDATLTNTLALVIDLGEKTNVGGLTLTFYKEYISMIGLALENKLTVSSSDDGETFAKVQDFTFEGEKITLDEANKITNQISTVDYDFEFTTSVNTRYLELQIPIGPVDPDATKAFADNKVMWEFIALTEIAVNDAASVDTSEPADESKTESAAESAAASSAPTSSSAPTESSKTPVTGDAGLAAIAVIAVIALAGTVVVARKRG